MNAVRIVPLLLVAFLVIGCSRDASSPRRIAADGAMESKQEMAAEGASRYMAAAVDQVAPAAPPPAPSAVVPPGIARQLVRNASLRVVVKDLDSTSRRAQALAVSLGGHVAHVDEQRPEGAPSATLVLRVPVARLDEALAALRAMGVRVEHETQGVEDVTEQVVDLDARLRTLEATERELRALLAESRQRGQKVADIMAVYRELTGIRTQIEQLQAQRSALETMAALSTIHLQLVPAVTTLPVAGTGWRPGETFRSSLRALVGGLRVVGDLAIFLVVVVIPLAGLAVVPALLVVRFMRRRGVRAATTG
jgi:hypothetical protein